MMKLAHKSEVRLESWPIQVAIVGTLNGFCPDYAETARERKQAECWTVFTGTVIAADPSIYDHARRRHAEAIVVEDGQVVEIEGRRYRVVVNSRNHERPVNSDPIKFEEVA